MRASGEFLSLAIESAIGRVELQVMLSDLRLAVQQIATERNPAGPGTCADCPAEALIAALRYVFLTPGGPVEEVAGHTAGWAILTHTCRKRFQACDQFWPLRENAVAQKLCAGLREIFEEFFLNKGELFIN